MAAPATTAESAPAMGEAKVILWPRLASFLSIMPLGVWTAWHLWNNLNAFRGGAEWQRAVTEYSSPVSLVLIMIVVLLPLVLHTIWGLQRIGSARPNNGRYGYYENLKYTVQRLAGLGLLLFLGAHLWLALIHPRLVEGHGEAFSDIAREMRFNGPTLPVYVLGVLALAYHLANGLSGFAWTWGIGVGRKSLRIWDRVAVIVFLVLLAMGWGAVYALWNAGAQFGG